MKYNLAFRYRIYPNKEQELLINKTFGCVRFVYNTILYAANKFYEETGKNKIITPASLKSENQFLKEVDSLALSNAQLNVKRSFTNFFQIRAKFPIFKSSTTTTLYVSDNFFDNLCRKSLRQFLIYSCNFDIFAFCLYQFLENFTFLDNDFCNFFNFFSNTLKYLG